MARWSVVLGVLGALLVPSVARAEKKIDRTVRLPTFEIWGRPARPMAAVDVARLALVISTPLPGPSLAENIERAAQKAPF